MISRFSTLFIGIFCCFYSHNLHSQGFATRIDTMDAESGQLICVPLRALGFNDMISFQYALHWDPEVLQFDHVQDVNMPIVQDDHFYSLRFPNTLLVGWSDYFGLGQSRADHSVLYEVCFQAIGQVGSSTEIICNGEGFAPGTGSAEAYNSTEQNMWDLELNQPGLVTISTAAGILGTSSIDAAQMVLQLTPNPTTSMAVLSLYTSRQSSGVLTVRDAAGRQVFEQKINLNAGENRFELPANVLAVKGLYQVSVQTETGTQTEMLSVN